MKIKENPEEMERCYFCGSSQNLERHHVFGGSLRKKSEQVGAAVTLCHNCHNEAPFGVHQCQSTRLALQQTHQIRIMKEQGWDMARWMQEFYKNYLEENRGGTEDEQ